VKPVSEQVRKLQAIFNQKEILDRRIAEQQLEHQRVSETARAGIEALVLRLADERGILALPPAQILAIFESGQLPSSPTTGRETRIDRKAAPGAELCLPVLGDTDAVSIVVKFGNHEGPKKLILQRLTKNSSDRRCPSSASVRSRMPSLGLTTTRTGSAVRSGRRIGTRRVISHFSSNADRYKLINTVLSNPTRHLAA
jgi:hypothetical protein